MDGATWRLDVANAIALRPGRDGGRVVVGMGDQADESLRDDAVVVLEAFSAEAFDPDVSAAATRFWFARATHEGYRGSVIQRWMSRPSVDLEWSAWSDLALDARRQYLEQVVAFANVAVNGRPVAASTPWRHLLGRPAAIADP